MTWEKFGIHNGEPLAKGKKTEPLYEKEEKEGGKVKIIKTPALDPNLLLKIKEKGKQEREKQVDEKGRNKKERGKSKKDLTDLVHLKKQHQKRKTLLVQAQAKKEHS